MNHQTDSYIAQLSHIIKHHESIFESKKDLKVGSYLNIKEKIFSLYKLFCLLDDYYDNQLNRDFLHDIIEIISFYNNTFSKNSNQNYDDEEKRLIAIIDTKLYYFDQLICYRANNSSTTQNYLRTQHIYKLMSTKHFLDVTKKEFGNIMGNEFISSKRGLTVSYTQKAIDFILNVAELNRQENQFDPLLDRLIKSKGKIALFRDMIDDDIKNLIHIFRFTVYNPGEVIIDEGEMSTDIFFILSGECSAHVNKNSVGTLKKNQIFGEFAFLLQQPRSATIRAISQTVIIKFRFDEELFRKYPFSFSMLYKNITEELILKIINMNNIKSSV